MFPKTVLQAQPNAGVDEIPEKVGNLLTIKNIETIEASYQFLLTGNNEHSLPIFNDRDREFLFSPIFEKFNRGILQNVHNAD